MYDRETIERALALVAQGMTPARASREMGGRPGKYAIQSWVAGDLPSSVAVDKPRAAPVLLPWQVKARAAQRALGGESCASVAAELGCSETAVRGWRDRLAARGEESLMMGNETAPRAPRVAEGDLPDDPAELKRMVMELQFEADLARELVEIVKKGPGADLAALSNAERARLARRLSRTYSLSSLLARLGLAESTYHYHRAADEDPRDPDADIRAEVARLFEESGRAHGYRRIHAALDPREDGTRPSEKRVRRVMAQEGLVPGRHPSPHYDSYDRAADESDPCEVPNLPLRPDGTHDFSAAAPNELWVTDVTMFSLPDDDRRVYLSPVLDCHGGYVVGWKVALDCTAEGLTNPSLAMACARLRPGDAPACHSDRGSQYHAASWVALCAANGVRRSMSRKAKSPDNARMEGFFGTLKCERFYGRDWRGWTAEDFMAEVDRWMVEHNESRRKLSLGWLTPAEYRRRSLAGAM